ERFQFHRDHDARELDVQWKALVSFPLPYVPVEGDDLIGRLRPRTGDLISFHRERLGVDAPVIDGAVNLVRRERRDRSEESEEITEACVEGPTSTRVDFIRSGFHHLILLRRDQVT